MIYGIFAIVCLFLILKFLSIPFRIIKRLLVNGISGLIILYILNIFTSFLGVYIEINTLNAIIAGCFGIPGIILILLFL